MQHNATLRPSCAIDCSGFLCTEELYRSVLIVIIQFYAFKMHSVTEGDSTVDLNLDRSQNACHIGRFLARLRICAYVMSSVRHAYVYF